MATLFQLPKTAPVFAGSSLASAKLYFFQSGTLTPIVTYTTAALSVAHTHPVVADGDGVFPAIFFNEGVNATYRMQLKTSTDVLKYDVDNLQTIIDVSRQRTAAEISAGVTPVNYAYEPGDVRRYGTNTTPGTTDMAAAIQAAINVLLQASVGKLILQPESYFVGNLSAVTPRLSASGLVNSTIEGNGAEILTTAPAATLGTILELTNPLNITINNLRFRDTATDLSVDWRGPRAISITSSGASGQANGVVLNNVYGEDLVTLVDVYGSAARRVRGIRLNNCRVVDSYYGINCREQGDDISGNLYFENVRRPYMCYGVRGHDLLLDITHDGSALGSNGAVVIKRFERDTKSVRIRSVFHGSTAQYGGLNVIETQPSSGTATIDDVDLDLHLADASYSATSIPIRIRAYDSGGSLQSTTNDVMDRISIRGNFGAWAVANTNNPILIESTPNTVRRLSLEGVWGAFQQDRQHYPGYRVKIAPNTEIYTKSGDLTSGNIAIDLADYNGRNFTLRLKTFAEREYDVGSTDLAYREHIVQGFNASAGAVTIGTTTVVHTIDNGTGTTLTIAAASETITVAFNTYNSADGYARVVVEHLSKFL